jgi:hypothetical protein
MDEKTKRNLWVFLPWVLTFALLGTFTLYGFYGYLLNPFETKSIKVNLLSAMRIHLLEGVEAEKNSVMALTDEESGAFADQARKAAEGVENNRKKIESIIQQEERPQETGMINEFNSCWSQSRKLDETILGLATQNTNLKASKISVIQSAQEMGRFEESIKHIIKQNTSYRQCNEAVLFSYAALTGSLKIFALHKPHIEETDDKQMDKIEQSIKSYDESVRKALRSLHGIANLNNNPNLKNAEAAYLQFMNLTNEIIRLSRMNTNIKSAELSLGKKRLISAQCQEILANLQMSVEGQRYTASR